MNSKLLSNYELIEACNYGIKLLEQLSENPDDLDLSKLKDAVASAETGNTVKLEVLKEYMSQRFARACKDYPECRPALRNIFEELFKTDES